MNTSKLTDILNSISRLLVESEVMIILDETNINEFKRIMTLLETLIEESKRE